MIDSSLTFEDRTFLHNLSVHLRKRQPAKNKEGVEVVVFPTGDCDKISEKLERLAEHGDSTAEIERIVI